MFALLHLLFALVSDRFKSRRRLEIENLYLRHQLNIALRRMPRRQVGARQISRERAVGIGIR
jgi:hypothetical protein